jgi:hypothetical protein
MQDLSTTANQLPQPHSHDLRLPDWGPYNKKYNGLSHISDLARGLRFELSVFPAYFRHKLNVPSVKWEGDYHPWEVAPGLSYFSYRYDLEWKDQVYCDVAYFALPDEPEANARVVRCEFVNNTDLPQHLALHYMAYLNFPPVRPYSDEAIIPAEVHVPPGAIWVDALDYDDLRFATPRPSDNLVYEGWYRGEARDHGFVNGTGLSYNFGAEKGDRVQYTFSIPRPIEDGVLLVRYRASLDQAKFEARGFINKPIAFEPTNDFAVCAVPLASVSAGKHLLELVAAGNGPIELDGFVVVEQADRDAVTFTSQPWHPIPQLQDGPNPNTVLLHYEDVSSVYGLAWTGQSSEVRQYFTSELDRTMRYFVNEHVQQELHVDDGGHFTNIFIRPIILEPHSRTILYGLICNGDEREVRARLADFEDRSEVLEDRYVRARQAKVTFDVNPSGQDYVFSQERMAATLLTNVVYPVYTRRSFIRHFTPGKWWDCLYTWDSGFISLGLLNVDRMRSIDCLNAYTTPVGDPHAAFIHHGSPVPVQIYTFQELWNRTCSPELLNYFYPRLRQFYLFLAGRLGSSTTRTLKSNLLKTWDYFYNSAGWDDYPAQFHVHANHLEATVTPVVTTAHVIRSAKILQQAARALGRDQDVRDYQADIDLFSKALNDYAWDEESGVFSYVVHDAAGHPIDFLRHAGGQNLNLGFDGVSPFFAGIDDRAQEGRLYARLESPDHLWTPVGLTAVDQSAPYYRSDGYWNGTVWLAYQWFFWKSMLDHGYGDMAFRIARTALDTWRAEVDATYNCFEHFVVASRRGAGWHHFGGLSAPVLAWFNAYHCPGTLTCGFDTWIEALHVSEDKRSLQATLRHDSNAHPWLAVAVLAPDQGYSIEWNGQSIEPQMRYPGTLEFSLVGSGTLTITPQTR